jgi:hypothetical protein
MISDDRRIEGIHHVHSLGRGPEDFTFSLSISENVRIRYKYKELYASKEERYVVVLLSGSDGNTEERMEIHCISRGEDNQAGVVR